MNRSERRPLSKKTERQKAAAEAAAKAAEAKGRTKQSGKGAWKVMDRASTVAAALVARKLTSVTWRAATGKQPPSNAKHPDVSNAEAVSWAILAGAGVELTKVLIRRGTANYWVKSTGKLPPGVKPLKTPEGKAAQAARIAALNEEPAGPPVEVPTGKKAKKARKP